MCGSSHKSTQWGKSCLQGLPRALGGGSNVAIVLKKRCHHFVFAEAVVLNQLLWCETKATQVSHRCKKVRFIESAHPAGAAALKGHQVVDLALKMG